MFFLGGVFLSNITSNYHAVVVFTILYILRTRSTFSNYAEYKITALSQSNPEFFS